VDELVSHAWMWMMMNHGHDIPDEEWRKFQDEVAGEDVPIVESQRPETPAIWIYKPSCICGAIKPRSLIANGSTKSA
jgi:hypothetical protein